MTRWIYRPRHPSANTNGMVDASIAYDDNESNSAPYVISDEMISTRHMADGKHFTSKAKFRAHTKAHGCIELGNELPTLTKPRPSVPLSREKRREDIRRTIYELRNGIRREE